VLGGVSTCVSNSTNHKHHFRAAHSVPDSGPKDGWPARPIASTAEIPNSPRPPTTARFSIFFCPVCADQFEVKAQKKPFGAKVADGAYFTKIERLKSATIPNLMLVNYDLDQRQVRNVAVVPRHFFVPDIIQQRPPLAPTARRAGWIGSNILLGRIPDAGRIVVLRNGVPEPKEIVLERWKQTLFLRRTTIEARGWLLEVMKAVDLIGRAEFTLDDVYAHEARLRAIYPNNNNVRPKVRQQLQVLRDNGHLDFLGKGRYRLRQREV
jgi:hypothetical protein